MVTSEDLIKGTETIREYAIRNYKFLVMVGLVSVIIVILTKKRGKRFKK